MKLIKRMQIWNLKREIKSYQSKIKLLKQVIKEILKEGEK